MQPILSPALTDIITFRSEQELLTNSLTPSILILQYSIHTIICRFLGKVMELLFRVKLIYETIPDIIGDH